MKTYEVIQEIQNHCSNNQMRDVFFEEIDIEDPDEWIRAREPHAVTIEREELPEGIRFHVWNAEILTVYNLTEI